LKWYLFFIFLVRIILPGLRLPVRPTGGRSATGIK
jgi:hypothetical protein